MALALTSRTAAPAEPLPGAASAADPSPAPLTPEQLAKRAQGGCPEAFRALVEQFEPRVYNFLLQLSRNPHDAEDLAQETFLKAYLALRQARLPRDFAPWLFTIARRTAISHFRRRKHAPEPPSPSPWEPASADQPAETVATRDENASLWRLARRLKPRQFEALWLRYGEGFDLAAIAQVMGAHTVTVKVLLHRARSQLAAWLSRTELGCEIAPDRWTPAPPPPPNRSPTNATNGRSRLAATLA
ncbi:MAG: sigma-70 family RNA polymerase sigma factor [Verrucomicrobia bacterium]|nr:sigma-70 family RNA polymerase sigma factor [Verrucomicrobiota bacterium]